MRKNMTKTVRPLIEYGWTDQKTVIKLVANALVNSSRRLGSKTLRVQRTAENNLSYLSRSSIISALEKITKAGDNLFLILQSNYTSRIVIREPVDFFDEGRSKLKIVSEDAPIILLPLDKFDNWREAQLRQKSISVKDLTEQTREVLYRTILAISKEYELTSNPSVRIRSLRER